MYLLIYIIRKKSNSYWLIENSFLIMENLNIKNIRNYYFKPLTYIIWNI